VSFVIWQYRFKRLDLPALICCYAYNVVTKLSASSSNASFQAKFEKSNERAVNPPLYQKMFRNDIDATVVWWQRYQWSPGVKVLTAWFNLNVLRLRRTKLLSIFCVSNQILGENGCEIEKCFKRKFHSCYFPELVFWNATTELQSNATAVIYATDLLWDGCEMPQNTERTNNCFGTLSEVHVSRTAGADVNVYLCSGCIWAFVFRAFLLFVLRHFLFTIRSNVLACEQFNS